MTDTESIDSLRVSFERQFAALHAKLDRLDECLRGNGKPGALLRIDRLERDARRQGKLIWMVIGALITSFTWVVVAMITGVHT